MTTIITRAARAAGAAMLLLLAAGCGAQQSATPIPTPTPAAVAAAPPAAAPTSALGNLPGDLSATWNSYRTDFIQGDGRVIDHERVSVTTSEGQSYALLRSVWMNDRPEFDLVWQWTHANLQVRSDHLFGYLWGQTGSGNWTILSHDSATDADEDIALALVFAYHRWHDPSYLSRARAVIGDIWRHEVATVKGKPYVTAGNWAVNPPGPGPEIDPSYLAPYAYRIFAGVDPAHPWHRVVNTSYAAINACTFSPLGAGSSAGLPPNWCALDRATGKPQPSTAIKQAPTYGYDAFRTMWRVALDWQWNHDPRARTYLQRASFLRATWTRHHALAAQYTHSGKPADAQQDPTVYAGAIANFSVSAPSEARAVALNVLLPNLHQAGSISYWGDRYNYYEQNWVWFGLALYGRRLPNLAAS